MTRAVSLPAAGRTRASSPPAADAAQATAPPLSRLLLQAAKAVRAVQQGQSAPDALAACPAALRPGTQALTFHTLRVLGTVQALRDRLVTRRPAPRADAVLLVGLALMQDTAEGAPPYPPHTVVDQAVHAARQSDPHLSGLINAVLRHYLREREALHQGLQDNPVARWNHPLWWIERLQADWPQQVEQLLSANNRRAPMVLRVDARRTHVQDVIEQLHDAGQPGAQVAGPWAVRLAQPVPVDTLPGFGQGLVSVQDAAAQCAAPLLLGALGQPADRPLRLLDACAAPGGKTAHLLELAQSQARRVSVTALDIDPQRTERIRDTLQRIGAQAEVRVADAAQPQAWWDGQPFDGILLDAPCTASGIVRRHPDIRWLRRAQDVPALAATQATLLRTLWPLLAPGGALLYATCSAFRAEGSEPVADFLREHADAQALPAPGHLLPSANALQPTPCGDAQPLRDHDGFFYALLRKATPRASHA